MDRILQGMELSSLKSTKPEMAFILSHVWGEFCLLYSNQQTALSVPSFLHSRRTLHVAVSHAGSHDDARAPGRR